MYVLPNTAEAREDFEWLIREIIAGGGEAILCEASFLAGLTDHDIRKLLQQRGPKQDPAKQGRRVIAETDAPPPPTTTKPRRAVWVTRRDIHVDRIASAWLIWRFIDPDAQFKFVDGPRYTRRRGELRFDMFEAEYTHEGVACTFEVLLDAFGLRPSAALSAIAQIVHDIDFKEEAFGRAETAETVRALNELYTEYAADDERLEHGVVLFEQLYGLLGAE